MLFKILRRMVGRTLTLAVPLVTAVAIAQGPANSVCATIVREALQAANNACSSTSRNEVCYGNVQGAVTPAEGVTDLTFEDVGDVAGIAQIQSLQLSPLNEADNQWGVALMQLQATLPDTLPGQNVTFLMFGDVTVEDNTGDQVRVDGSVLQAANLRLSPSMTGPILGSLPESAAIIGTGKAVNSAGELWVRLRYEDYRTKTGWMLGSLIDVDLSMLPDVATDSLTYSPMQAFYFTTGIGQTQCADAPVNGVLVQTPQGAGQVNFNVNGIDIALGSTALLTAPDNVNNTCLSLITGDADLRSGGKNLDLNPGERSCTPINADGTSGEPGKPEPFDPQEIASVAEIIQSLPQDVEIPDPAPTRAPTQVPVPATAIPTAVPTSVPTDQPPQEQPPQATQPTEPTVVPTDGPTLTPTVVPRSIDVAQSRNGGYVTFTASTVPDAASDYTWYFGEGSASGPTTSFGYSAGEAYSFLMEACWADGECITRTVEGQIPACPIYYLDAPVTISLTFDGSNEEYDVYRSMEDCSMALVSAFGASSPNFSHNAYYGETWQVIEVSPYAGYVAVDVFIDVYPVSYYVPGVSATPEVMK